MKLNIVSLIAIGQLASASAQLTTLETSRYLRQHQPQPQQQELRRRRLSKAKAWSKSDSEEATGDFEEEEATDDFEEEEVTEGDEVLTDSKSSKRGEQFSSSMYYYCLLLHGLDGLL